MSERVYERFLLFMNAVDDDLLEEALTVPKRRRAVSWRSLAAAAAWLGEEAALDRPVRSMALTTGEEETAMLYLRDQEGGRIRL